MWQSHSEQLYINKHHLPVSLSRLTLSNKQTPIDQLVPKQLYLSHRHGRIGSCPQTSEQVRATGVARTSSPPYIGRSAISPLVPYQPLHRHCSAEAPAGPRLIRLIW